MAEVFVNDWYGRLAADLDVNAGVGGTVSVLPGAPASAVGNRVRARVGTEIVTADVTTANSWTIVARESEDSDRYPKKTWKLGTAVSIVLTAGGLAQIIGDSNLPAGGAANALLKKNSATDFDAVWFDLFGGQNTWTGNQFHTATLNPAITINQVGKNGWGIKFNPSSVASSQPAFYSTALGDPNTVVSLWRADGSIGVGYSNSSGWPGRLVVQPRDANQVGTVIRGFASQTANLQEWQTSTGALLLAIDSAGRIYSESGITIDPGPAGSSLTVRTLEGGPVWFQLENGSFIVANRDTPNEPILNVMTEVGAQQIRVGKPITTPDGTTVGSNGTDAGTLTIQTGIGGNGTGEEFTSGNGGDIQIFAGDGGTTGLSGGGSGGNITLQAGVAGSGLDGNINLNTPNGTTALSVTGSAVNINTESFFGQMAFLTQGALAEAASIIAQQLRAENYTAWQTPLVVKGADGQSAPLMEVKDSTETTLVSVDSTGKLNANNAEILAINASQIEVGDVVNVGANVFTPSIGDNGGSTGIGFNGGTGTISLNAFAGIAFPSTDDSTAANGTLYFSTTQSKLVYKDPGGVVNALY
jgi:hypothetical protein